MGRRSVLDDIVANKHKEVEADKTQLSLSSLKALCTERTHCLNFLAALTRTDRTAIIAECKKKSPSKGIIAETYDAASIAKTYELSDAAAISVLTDHDYFGGTLEDLRRVAEAVSIPVPRKDFILDEYQIHQAYRYGASTFLLLASVLDPVMIQYFIEVGRDYGMEALVEVHDERELHQALTTDARIIGINNRNLGTMVVQNDHASSLLSKLSDQQRQERLFVLESGITSQQQIKEGVSAGFRAFLVGESLMRSENPAALLKNFTAKENLP